MVSGPDWLAALGLVIPAATGLGGYLLAGRNEEARDLRAAARERATRQTALAERLDERKHTFILDTLLEMQEVLQLQMRATAKVILQDQKTLKEQGGLFQLPTEIDQEAYDRGVRFNHLRQRVLDDDLREGLAEFKDLLSRIETSAGVLNALPPDQAITILDGQLHELGDAYTPLNERVGKLIRGEIERTPPELDSQSAVTPPRHARLRFRRGSDRTQPRPELGS